MIGAVFALLGVVVGARLRPHDPPLTARQWEALRYPTRGNLATPTTKELQP